MINGFKGPSLRFVCKGGPFFYFDQYRLLHTKSIINTLTTTKKNPLNRLLNAYFIVYYSGQVQLDTRWSHRMNTNKALHQDLHHLK
jgi:uncharacterized iron-regulated membrane protein